MDSKDTQEKTGEGCCSKKACCGCKALAAVALLAVGGLGGYFWARHGSCAAPVPAATSPVK